MGFFRRAKNQPKSCVEILGPIPTLVRDMRWVLYHDFKRPVAKRHGGVVRNNRWMMSGLYIQADNRSCAAAPKPAVIHSGVEDRPRRFSRIKAQESFDEFRIIPEPNGSKRLIFTVAGFACSRSYRKQL